MSDVVYNLEGTSGRKCQCNATNTSWLDHWERLSGLPRPDKCCAKWCRNPVQVGAHVRHEGSDGRIPWIIPFCQYHNKRPVTEPIEVKDGVTLCGASMKVDCIP